MKTNKSVQELYRPVLSETIPTEFNEAKDWWDEQIYRCKNGWIAPDGKPLNGYLYFYLNFTRIYILVPDSNDATFKHISPLYRDNDDDILTLLWEDRYKQKVQSAKNFSEMKGIGSAWSQLMIGLGVYFLTFEHNKNLAYAYPNNDVIDTERKWFIDCWESLHPYLRTYNGNALTGFTTVSGDFEIGFETNPGFHRHNTCRFDVVDPDGPFCIYKGERLNVIFICEAGLWLDSSLINFITENESSIRLGKDQFGRWILGGTLNSRLNKSRCFLEIFKNTESFNSTSHFTPATKVRYGFIDYHTGKSNHEEALKHIMNIRNSKKSDPVAYDQELIENPLTWQEAFLM